MVADFDNLGIDHRFAHFWDAFGPDFPIFEGKSVLEIGCGEGSRCIEAAAHGADRVVGLDPYSPSISAARDRLQKLSLPLRERIFFFGGVLSDLPLEKFDLVISEDTFEHVLNVRELLVEIKSRLNPGGRFYLGFGPLYHAYNGDHGWVRAVLPGRSVFPWPWGHLLLDRYAFRKLSVLHGKQINNTHDWPYLSLNRHTASEYEDMFKESGLRIVYLRINNAKSLKGRLFSALRRIPGFRRYFTMNMYVVFENA